MIANTKPLSLIAQRSQHIKIRNPNIEIRNKPESNKSKSRKYPKLESDLDSFGICSVWII